MVLSEIIGSRNEPSLYATDYDTGFAYEFIKFIQHPYDRLL